MCKRCRQTGLLAQAGVVAAREPEATVTPAPPVQTGPRLRTRRDGLAGHDLEPYRLHVEAVSVSCSRNSSAEAKHKALEQKHDLAVRRFQAARDGAQVLALWRQRLERSDVAGALWAALTHRAATGALARLADGNADIRSQT